MTLLDIETFLGIVKYGNLSIASQKMFISQPALTRRIQLMEQELGYPLIVRQKGHRSVQLTEQGVEFYHIAWKWQLLWEETNAISSSIHSSKKIFSVASVNSVSRSLLRDILPGLTSQQFGLRLYNAFSEDAYQYMSQGLYDLAFIEQQDFTQKKPQKVHAKPAFSESFVVATHALFPVSDPYIALELLKTEKEIYVPWNNEFKSWHAANFDERITPLVILKDLSLIDCFFSGENWALVPYAMGETLRLQGANIYHILNGPPDRIIYYLTREGGKSDMVSCFLHLLDQHLQTMPPNEIRSFLQDTKGPTDYPSRIEEKE